MDMENRIQEQHKLKGWSMQRLADAIGTTKSQIFKLERGDRRLTVNWMNAIADALGCSAADLLPATAASQKTVAVPVSYRIDSAMGGWVQPLEEEEQYSLQLTLPERYRNTSLRAMTMEGGLHERFGEGSELIFSEVIDNADLVHGAYVLVEEQFEDQVVQHIGQLDVSPHVISIHFRASHPRHHHTLVYWQEETSPRMQESGVDKKNLPAVPLQHKRCHIRGVLAKHLQNV